MFLNRVEKPVAIGHYMDAQEAFGAETSGIEALEPKACWLNVNGREVKGLSLCQRI